MLRCQLHVAAIVCYCNHEGSMTQSSKTLVFCSCVLVGHLPGVAGHSWVAVTSKHQCLSADVEESQQQHLGRMACAFHVIYFLDICRSFFMAVMRARVCMYTHTTASQAFLCDIISPPLSIVSQMVDPQSECKGLKLKKNKTRKRT